MRISPEDTSFEKTSLEVKDLEKKFIMRLMDNKEIFGCHRINFSLDRGEFLGIFGPSGIGKSTILKCIYRTYLPSGGQILFHSEQFGKIDLVKATERQIIALRQNELSYVSQFLQVIPRVSAQEIVASSLLRQSVDRNIAMRKAGELLSVLKIPEELWEACPATFSGGEKQRVNIAQAIINQPKLLLLDEPTASLDGETRQVVLDLLKDLKRKGTVMLGIFHDLDTMMEIADFSLSMIDGVLTKVA